MKAKSFRLGEVEINSIAVIRARLGFKTDIDAIRYALAAAIALQGGTVENAVLRTAQVSAKPATYAEVSGQTLTDKQAILDKLGGPAQNCPKHGGLYGTCWSLHR